MELCTCGCSRTDHWIEETLDGEQVVTSCNRCGRCMKFRPTLKPSELLDAAAVYIVEHGWVQGTGSTKAGEVCALMAVRSAALAAKVPAAIVAEATRSLEAVALELYAAPVSVPVFNDLYCVDQADAEYWIGKARLKLEEKGR